MWRYKNCSKSSQEFDHVETSCTNHGKGMAKRTSPTNESVLRCILPTMEKPYTRRNLTNQGVLVQTSPTNHGEVAVYKRALKNPYRPRRSWWSDRVETSVPTMEKGSSRERWSQPYRPKISWPKVSCQPWGKSPSPKEPSRDLALPTKRKIAEGWSWNVLPQLWEGLPSTRRAKATSPTMGSVLKTSTINHGKGGRIQAKTWQNLTNQGGRIQTSPINHEKVAVYKRALKEPYRPRRSWWNDRVETSLPTMEKGSSRERWSHLP